MSRSIPILVACFLLAAGCENLKDASRDAGRFFGRAGDAASGKTARSAAVKMEDQYFPDERREGINDLAGRDYGRREPYTQRYAQIAQTDSDWLVRATAVRALNRSRDRNATQVFVQGLSDKNEQVRLEACKGLIHIPDDAAVPALVKLVQNTNENRDVRIAAADALKHYRTVEVARALTNNLGGRDFGVAWQSHQSLILLTGRDLMYDEAAWLAYLTGPEKPFG